MADDPRVQPIRHPASAIGHLESGLSNPNPKNEKTLAGRAAPDGCRGGDRMDGIATLLRNGFDHHRAGRLAQAEAHYQEALRSDPRQPDALHLLGVVAHDAGRYDLAVQYIGRAVEAEPARANYHFNLGEAYRKLGRLDEARSSYEEALRLDPDHVTAHNGLGLVHQERGAPDVAESCFRRAARLAPGHPFVLNNLAAALIRLGRLDEARSALEEAIQSQPDYADALRNLGTVDMRLGRFAEARAWFERAVALAPRDAAALHFLGWLLHKEGRARDAEARLRQALRVDPGYAPAHHILGAVLKDAQLLDEAQASVERALQIDPNYVEALSTLAVILAAQGKAAEARAAIDRALAVRPDDALKIRSALLLPVIYESLDELRLERDRLRGSLERLDAGPLAVGDPYHNVGVTAFYLAYHGLDDRDLLAKLAAVYRKACPGLDFVAPHCQGPAPGRPDGGPIRVGFLSAYFRFHSMGKLNLGFVRHLSREKFKVTLFTLPGADDPLARALHEAADRVVTLPRSLDAARRQIADEGLDVLYYTDIGMDPLTYFLAFARLAPVQCVSWGHPVTSGIPTIDYFLSCDAMEPQGAEAHYTERLVRFGRVNTDYAEPERTSPVKTRRDFGLDDGAHVYACTQSLYKMHPEFDAVLGAILRGDPQGVVVLLSGYHPHWDRTLIGRFRRAFPGEADRVRFLPRQSPADFLQLQAASDVLLDTFPFGGGTTCYEAFAFGTPVVTLPGASLRGRIALALYHQMGVPDCVATDPEDYVRIALRLGTDPSWRGQVSARILARKHRLFEDAEAVRELEQFLLAVARARTDTMA
jgi:predicted O-linked N-acetylglucosamine transferase (SPINDLY family)